MTSLVYALKPFFLRFPAGGQVVFGEGLGTAPVMLIGEQPAMMKTWPGNRSSARLENC